MAEDKANETPPKTGFDDPEKWNQLLYDQANKNHLHQDNLRWTLSAGFGAFFLLSIATVYKPEIAENETVMHYLQLIICILGSAYFVVILVEGWYYNLYLDYLLQCEKNLNSKTALQPLCAFDRSSVTAMHPSFIFVLFLVAVANTFHLFEYLLDKCGLWWALAASAIYVLTAMIIAVKGRVPQRLDRTVK